MRLTPQAVARTAQRPGLILATAEEWASFAGPCRFWGDWDWSSCGRADSPNQVWSWDISYLPTNVKGNWLYLYLVISLWSKKVLAWDVENSEDPKLATDLVSRACLRERIGKQRKQPLILHAYDGNAMRAATL